MLKREENQLKQDSEKKNMSETVIRKKILVKTVIRKNISDRMLKTMKNPNAPREGRGVPLQRQNLEIFLVSYYVFHGRVTLFFPDNFSTECRITMKFLHIFFQTLK